MNRDPPDNEKYMNEDTPKSPNSENGEEMELGDFDLQ
jgi:hypothetical protein